MMHKQNHMINKVKKKYWPTTHKFGIRIPKTLAEALQLDAENGNHLWEEAIKKEMSRANVFYVSVAGCMPEQVRANQVDKLCRHQEIKCHNILIKNGFYEEGSLCGHRSHDRSA